MDRYVQRSSGAADTATSRSTPTLRSTSSDRRPLHSFPTPRSSDLAEADLSITKTDSPDPVRPGGSLTYTIGGTNGGTKATPRVTMKDPPPELKSFQSETHPSGWTCTMPAVGSTSTVRCTTASLASA